MDKDQIYCDRTAGCKGCKRCGRNQNDFILSKYEILAAEIGKLTETKNKAYGNSFAKASLMLKVLYPDGIPPESYGDALAITRVIDKLFRLATRKNAFGESPWKDICGYALLGMANDEEVENETSSNL